MRQKTRFERLIAKARRTNAERDAIDISFGHATPGQCPIDIELATAWSAIECGINTEDWDVVAEGWLFLDGALKRLRARPTSAKE